MRIYGKTLSEIFSLLPWPYKAVVTLGAAFFIFAVPYSLNYFMSMGLSPNRVEPLNFPGLSKASNKGVMDPAVASDGRNVLMAHTVINVDNAGAEPQVTTEVVLERAENPCRVWSYIPGGFPAVKEDNAMGPDGEPLPPGLWRAETPGVVYDPDDKGRQWKIYAYKYYWTGSEQLARYIGIISEKTAPDLYGPWSDERYVMGAGPVRFADGKIRNQPPEPYNSLVQFRLNTLSPELQDVYFYSRPSLQYVSRYKFLFMTLSAFKVPTSDNPQKTPDRVVMLKSLDHGQTWSYAGTPLRQEDVSKMGSFTKMGGATLLQYEDKLYLAAVLGDKDADALGTFIIPFDNPVKGELSRDATTGAPVVVMHHARNSIQPSRIGGGYATYTDACNLGMIISEYSDLRASFQIFKTYKKPVFEE